MFRRPGSFCCAAQQPTSFHVPHVDGRFVFPHTTAPVVGRSQLGGRPMIDFNNERNDTTWQSSFIAMLPEIEQKLRLAFCRLVAPEAREDAIEEGVVHSLVAYVRLVEQGRAEVATASSLAWYSSRHVKRGRPAGGRMNGKEPLSRYGQISNDIEIERQAGNWIDALVEDKRATVADQVAAKMDVGAWF